MSEDLTARMRDTWDMLARRNAMHYIATEREEWDRDAFLRSGRETLHTLLHGVGHRPRGVALDLGCGIGRLSLALADEFARVQGIDVSREMIGRANELKAELGYSNVDFYCNNGLDIAFVQTDSCDLGFSYIVLQHLPDNRIVRSYIRELARVVKPGGYVLFQVPVYRPTLVVFPWRIAQRVFRRLLWLLERLALITPEKRLAFRGSRLTPGELHATLADAGLKTISIQRTASPYRFCDDALVYAAKRRSA